MGEVRPEQEPVVEVPELVVRRREHKPGVAFEVGTGKAPACFSSESRLEVTKEPFSLPPNLLEENVRQVGNALPVGAAVGASSAHRHAVA